MYPFTKKKTPGETQQRNTVSEDVRQRLSETQTKLDEVVRQMQERLAQRALQHVKVK